MECPVCKEINRIELDLHSDGFAKEIYECTKCDSIWKDESKTANVIFIGSKHRVAKDGDGDGGCPYCHDKIHIEIDMHSDGYSKELLECGNCGTTWTEANRHIKVLHGPTIEKNVLS